jgi:hypothetical protein
MTRDSPLSDEELLPVLLLFVLLARAATTLSTADFKKS